MIMGSGKRIVAGVVAVGGFVATLLPALASASIYTIGRLEDSNGSAQVGGTYSWLETWDNSFSSSRLASTNIGTSKASNFGSPHVAVGVGDINNANAGDEFLLGRSDGIGVVVKQDGSTPRLGGALFFRSNPSVAGHAENTGLQGVAIANYHANAGNEIVTMANNGTMEIWSYDQGTGTIASRLDLRIWTGISAGERAEGTGYSASNRAFDGFALGEFSSANSGLEVALLRSDGLVEVWDAHTTGTFPSTTPSRLAIWDINSSSSHEPLAHFFSGDLDPGLPGDELATIGTDGWYEIYNPMTGTRLSAPNNAYVSSAHDPFLAVTADPIPEPCGLAIIGLVGAIGGGARRRRRSDL